MSSSSPESLVVRAGAGAGKTTALVAKVLDFTQEFMKSNKRKPRVAVTTFTRKATQELRERLTQKALEQKKPDLIEFVQMSSHLHISTIHGVLSLFLRKYGSAIELSPKFTLLDEPSDAKLIRKVIKKSLNPERARLLEDLSLKKILQAFRKYEEVAFALGESPPFWTEAEILEVLQARSQKWQKKARHLLNYIEEFEAPAPKAEKWREYAQILGNCLRKLASEPEAASQHFSEFLNLKPSPRFKKEADEEVKTLRQEIQEEAEDFATDYYSSKEGIKRSLELNQIFAEWCKEIFLELKTRKIKQGVMTMSDLEGFSLDLIRRSPESASAFSEDWDYWLIDEYQDTSPLQVEILSHLVADRPTYVVGDPQQSIYLFRGARSEVFAQREFENLKSGGKNLSQKVNFRSRPEVVNFLNYFFTNLSPEFSEMEVGRPEWAEPEVPAVNFIQAVSEMDEPESENLQQASILGRCAQLLGQGVSADQICILSRTNKELSELASAAGKKGLPVQVHAASQFYNRSEIREALQLLKFIINPHDNVNFVALIRTPWFRVSDVLLAAGGRQKPLSYWRHFLEQSRVQGQGESFKSIHRLQKVLEDSKAAGVGQAWREALWNCGLILTAQGMDGSGRREANLWKLIYNVQKLERRPGFSYAEFCENGMNMGLDSESSEGDSDATPVLVPERINLMTIHASKGLQFEYVIIPSAGKWKINAPTEPLIFDETRQRFWLSLVNPHTGSASAPAWSKLWIQELQKRNFAEYDRLLYVALTRAKKGIDIFWDKLAKDSWASRMWKGGDTSAFNFKSASLSAHDLAKVIYKASDPITGANSISKRISSSQTAQKWVSVTDLLAPDLLELSASTTKVSANSRKTTSEIQASLEKALTGVGLHRVFESLKYRAFESLQYEFQEESLEKRSLEFLKSWNSGEILSWIDRGFVEAGFALPFQNVIVQGQIDLWAPMEDKIVIVDYKTGSEKYADKAFEQMNIYAWALSAMNKFSRTPAAEIYLAAVFPLSQQVILKKAESLQKIEDKIRRRLGEIGGSSLQG